jgi:hypothetical protein
MYRPVKRDFEESRNLDVVTAQPSTRGPTSRALGSPNQKLEILPAILWRTIGLDLLLLVWDREAIGIKAVTEALIVKPYSLTNNMISRVCGYSFILRCASQNDPRAALDGNLPDLLNKDATNELSLQSAADQSCQQFVGTTSPGTQAIAHFPNGSIVVKLLRGEGAGCT